MNSNNEEHRDQVEPKAHWLFNHYTLLILLFICWMLFVSDHSRYQIYLVKKDITKLEKERQFYIKQIETDTRNKEELYSSRENLEKFAREHYYMKERNEDLFIIVED